MRAHEQVGGAVQVREGRPNGWGERGRMGREVEVL
jgi:hypothetical protein